MTIELIAPAKLNLTLEVLGKRPDGYHEIASIMQTIDLADRIRIEPADTLTLVVQGVESLRLPSEASDNLVMRAAVALREKAGRSSLGARIALEKRVPASMGLGGGSSDAAAVLRGLNHLWHLDLDAESLSSTGAAIGSDVPFFLHAGTAVVSGRGEIVKPLPDATPFDVTLFVGDFEIIDKTRQAYGLLEPSDLSDAGRTRAAVQALRRGEPLTSADLVNVFDRHVRELAPSMGRAMAACRDTGVRVVACGSGPAFFTLKRLEDLHEFLLQGLQHECGVRAIACHSLSRAEALALTED